MTLFMLSFAIGFSSTPWTVNSEIYPVHLAGTASGLAAATHWICSFIVSSIFLTVMDTNEGKVITFLVLSIFPVLAFVFVYYLLPETANKKVSENISNIIGENVSEETESNND